MKQHVKINSSKAKLKEIILRTAVIPILSQVTHLLPRKINFLNMLRFDPKLDRCWGIKT